MNLIHRLNEIIAERHLLTHPFYMAWSKGELSLDIIKRYASQYYAQVNSFPTFLSLIHSTCRSKSQSDKHIRKVIVENLADEELHGTDHPTLWMNFAKGLGVDEETVLNEIPLPETQALVDTFYDLAQDKYQGLCALYAYECQVPAVSISKINGLKEFYNIHDESTLQFFSAHQMYDIEHSQRVAELIEHYVSPELAENAARTARDAQWLFLDGMCRVGGIQC
jgi:pyrroloquinoline-quinone synthase